MRVIMLLFKAPQRLVSGLLLLLTAAPALAVPTITATPNPIVIPEGQTVGKTTLTWDAGPNYSTARVWLQIDKGPDSLFAASARGSSDVTVTLGKPQTFKLYSGDGAQVLASITVTSQTYEPRSPIARVLPRDAVLKDNARSSPFTFFIQKVSATPDVSARGNYADIAFTTMEPSHAVVEVSTKPSSDFPDTTPAGRQPAPAFPPGTVTMSRNDMLGAKQSAHSFRMDGLGPNRTYYFVVTSTGADGRTYRYGDHFKTFDSRRVKLVFERVHFTYKDLNHGASDAPKPGIRADAFTNGLEGVTSTGPWCFPPDPSWASGLWPRDIPLADASGPPNWDVHIEAVTNSAADQLPIALQVSYWKDTIFGPECWTTAADTLDTTLGGTNQAGAGSFRLPLSPKQSTSESLASGLPGPWGLEFEAFGRYEVSYAKPTLFSDVVEIRGKRDVPIGGAYHNALITRFLQKKSGTAPLLIPTQLDLNALAAKGEALATADPRAAELRSRQPDIPTRRGFDIGMAASDGQTLPGPGKQRIHDALSRPEQGGFDIAAGYSLERNRNVALAAVGLAIAKADAAVQKARTADPDVLYWLGFDIASGIFGDPALGAQGNSASGPGSMRVRDSLSAPGQRGFNAAMAFHLSRHYKR